MNVDVMSPIDGESGSVRRSEMGMVMALSSFSFSAGNELPQGSTGRANS